MSDYTSIDSTYMVQHKRGRWIEATKAEYEAAPEERRKILYSKPPLIHPTGEQLYTMISKEWAMRFEWRYLGHKEAWNKAAADLVWCPDTLAHKLAFDIERDRKMYEDAMKPLKGSAS